VYPILQAPHATLRAAARTVDLPAEKLSEIIARMEDTLLAQKDPPGVGLAANQVGLPYRLFVARFSTKKGEPVRVFINPEIVSHSEDFQPSPADKKKPPLEGCLSIPKLYGAVKRWQSITLKYQIIDNSSETTDRKKDNRKWFAEEMQTFTGFPAVVIQHEMDHLEGRVFTERILEQKGKLYRITGKDKAGKEKWEEITL
jgi:peptide deformylase